MMRNLLLVLLAFCQFQCQSQEVQKKKFQEDALSPSKVVTHQIPITELERERTVRVYLPPGYEEGKQDYPVIYLHDGQNLFDDRTAFAGEWEVDETLDRLALDHDLPLIAVGIDNGGANRIHELNPFEHPKYGRAEGDAYLQYLVHTVKPYIDSTYRTSRERENTALFGSSLGGLISHYGLLQHPETFGKGGFFSPSYWFAPDLAGLTREQPFRADARLYLLAGGKEEDMVGPAKSMRTTILEGGHPEARVHLEIDPDGEHREAFWKAHFQEAVLWLFRP